jgi:hypothetical protein
MGNLTMPLDQFIHSIENAALEAGQQHRRLSDQPTRGRTLGAAAQHQA